MGVFCTPHASSCSSSSRPRRRRGAARAVRGRHFFLTEIELARVFAISPHQIAVATFADADARLGVFLSERARTANRDIHFGSLYLSLERSPLVVHRRRRGTIVDLAGQAHSFSLSRSGVFRGGRVMESPPG